MPVAVTFHALERYMERIDPTVSSFVVARECIEDAMAVARRLREKTAAGDIYYEGEDIRFVVAEEGSLKTVLTVVSTTPQAKNPGGGEPENAAELAARLRESLGEQERRDALKSGTLHRDRDIIAHLEAKLAELRRKLKEANPSRGATRPSHTACQVLLSLAARYAPPSAIEAALRRIAKNAPELARSLRKMFTAVPGKRAEDGDGSLLLTDRDWEAIQAEWENPSEPTPAAVEAARKYLERRGLLRFLREVKAGVYCVGES